MKKRNTGRLGFTLIELLVVVLIVGILASIALPQYQKAVEKAHIAESLPVVRAIAQAHQAFFMANGRYATSSEIDLLDVSIPGRVVPSGSEMGKIQTKNFVYGPNGSEGTFLAIAYRIEDRNNNITNLYYVYIAQDDPSRVRCRIVNTTNSPVTPVQRQLCTALDQSGNL